MTLNEYIANLQDFARNYMCGDMLVVDSYDEDPSEPEIVEGTVVLADKF